MFSVAFRRSQRTIRDNVCGPFIPVIHFLCLTERDDGVKSGKEKKVTKEEETNREGQRKRRVRKSNEGQTDGWE